MMMIGDLVVHLVVGLSEVVGTEARELFIA